MFGLVTEMYAVFVCVGVFAFANGYVNVALNKPVYLQDQFVPWEDTFDASNAVDGRKSDLRYGGGQCALSYNNQTATWWVNLTTIHSIHHITIYFRTDNKPLGPSNYLTEYYLGFSVYVSNTTDRLQGTLCYKDDNFTLDTIPAVFTTTCPVHGQYVIYYNERLPGVTYPDDYSYSVGSDLCEVEVYARSGQLSTGIIIWICVASAFLLGMTGLVLFIWRRKKKRLNTPGPNYLRPHTSRFQPVSIEMNQPLAVKGRADGYEIVDKSKNKDHLLKKKKKNYEQATDDTFLNEYRTRGNGTSEGYENIGQSKNKDHLMKKKKKNYEQATDDTFLNEYKTRGNVTSEGYKNINTIKNKDNLMKKNNYEQATDDTFLNEYRTVGNENQDRPHVPQNRTADFEEEIETNAIHGPDESTTITFA